MKQATGDEKFWSLVLVTGFCWVWMGNVNDSGYGRYGASGCHRAHRYSYEGLVEPIPEGMTLDHLCRNTLCINPDHLEPTTNRENILRSFSFSGVNARKTRCPAGHEYDEENTYVDKRNMRHCRRCGAAGARRRRAARREAAS